ncbi:MAG: OmpA family protein [Rhodospirillales bacterium]|nr:MAG: OmpA family protein [Rhodospirillales bacterium]
MSERRPVEYLPGVPARLPPQLPKPARQTAGWTVAIPQPNGNSGRSGHTPGRAVRPTVILAAALLMMVPGAAAAQHNEPLAPPAVAPVSRLTITPSEFERWLAGTPQRPEVAVTPEDLPPGPGLVAPPPPVLVTPPPPPRLVSPPPAPTGLEPPPPRVEPPEAPAIPPGAATAEPPAPLPGAATTTTPPAPVLAPPEAPQVATLPPDSRDTTPLPATPEALPRPDAIRILYAADATDLPKAAQAELDELAGWLTANPGVRVQIVGYASAATTSASDARRRSLFRTLAVRTYLIENGVLSTRMDVRALGDRTDEEPKDRVEVRLPEP